MARRTGRTSSVGRGSGKFKRSTGRARSVSGRRSGAHRAAAPRPSGHELVPVICSECFEEFAFDTGVRSETLVCPVCEHSAARPDDATLHRISSLRKGEKTNATIGLALTIVAAGSYLAWVLLLNNPANQSDAALFWGPLGVAILCVFALVAFIFKYENNRWEFYF
ncbi:MAG: hypothetical protein D6731_07340 [Planctomycetota bacterium]|nr:MAG: hypothetical protein D6731_07340 [Planctomycetota bacterium]